MNLGMAENPVKVVIDTNILISAMGFGGKPREILLQALEKKIQVIISPILLAEFFEVINKKFPKLDSKLFVVEKKIKKSFIVVQPKISLSISRDEDDNRVIEAALEGNCDFIITGDKDLLDLGKYKRIKIVTSEEFLKLLKG